MSKNEMIMLPREVVEQALWSLDNASHPHGKDWAEHGVARKALRAALDRPQAEQDPTPDGATHIQLQQGAFYKRVDGKWYVWSLMKNGEPHRWYISPGTAESCLDPLAATPKQKRQPLTDEAVLGVAKSIEIQFDSERLNEQIDDILAFARAIERAHGIGGKE